MADPSQRATSEEVTIPGAQSLDDGDGGLRPILPLVGSEEITQVDPTGAQVEGTDADLLGEASDLPALPVIPSSLLPARSPMSSFDEDTIVGQDITNARAQPPPPET